MYMNSALVSRAVLLNENIFGFLKVVGHLR